MNHQYLEGKTIKAWFEKAYGLHVLFVSLIVSEFVFMLFAIVLLMLMPTVGAIALVMSGGKMTVYIIAFIAAYYRRSTEYLEGRLNVNPELSAQILELIKQNQV